MKWTLLLGRVLFGGFFLASGFNHFGNAAQLAGYATAHGVPYPHVAVFVAGLLLVLGGLSVLLGVLPRVGLVLLLIFFVPVTLMMHNFWADTDAQQRMMDLTNFMKNTALTGAVLGLLALKLPWPLSLDAAFRRRAPAMPPHAPPAPQP